jgi:O-antigen ligase
MSIWDNVPSGLGAMAGSGMRSFQPAMRMARGLLGPSVEQTAKLLGISPSWATAILIVALAGALVGVALAAVFGLGLLFLGAVTVTLVVMLSFRWPLLPLLAYVVWTPVEEVVVLGPYGTLSRYAAIMFVIAYSLPRLRRMAFGAMPLSAWGFVVWATLSVAWAISPAASLEELPILGLLFATAVVVAAFIYERPNTVRTLLWAYTGSAVMASAFALVTFLLSGDIPGPNDRAAAIQNQNPAYFAATVLPAFVFCANELLQGRRVVVTALISALTGGAILASGTRAAWVGAIVAVALFILPRLSFARALTAVWLAAALAVAALQFPALTTLIAERASIAISSGGAGRTDIWTVGTSIYESSPLTGVGIANFHVAYTPEIVRESDVGVYSAQNPAYRAPHNIAISTLAELGPIGVALLAAFLIPLLARAGWGPDAPVIQAIVASLVSTAFFLDIVNRKQFWLFLAIACGLALLRARRASADP